MLLDPGGQPPPPETPDAPPTWDSGGAHVASEANARRPWVTFGSSLTCEKNTHLRWWSPPMRVETGPTLPLKATLAHTHSTPGTLIPVHTLILT